ncbi:MAG: polysaccharide biosynthesis/export family protein [Pyrinomonadaceae bacterium]
MNGFVFKILLVFSIIFGLFGRVDAQEKPPEEKKVNFGFTRNPSSKVKRNTVTSEVKNSTEEKVQISSNTNPPITKEVKFESRSAAQKTLDIAKRANLATLPPTEIYRVGVSDVLFISLQNAPAKTSTYFTVLNDGTIDYPLAGEMILVSGLTVEEIEELLQGKIKLYENPQVAVKVREYASHPITVLGLVEKSGEKFIQREAVPLFVVKAESIVQANADQVVIRRGNTDVETVSLTDPKADEILILPGDILEFRNGKTIRNSNSEQQFYYIGGNIASGGQKDFHDGMTLTQAILASGGLKKSNAKSVVIRRKNENGLLEPAIFNLKEIKNGKAADPVLQAGDTIEIDD